MDADGAPIADSGVAHRVLVACIDRLSTSDMDRVVKMLVDADLLSKDEERAIGEGMKGGPAGGDPDMASDAAIMSRRRAQVAAGQRPASCLREPIRRPGDVAGFNERFPHATRLK